MSSASARLANAITRTPERSGRTAGLGQDVKYWPATFVASETVDTNLSQIQVGATTFRFVPRLGSAWTSAPAVGTALAVLQCGGSFLILGTQLGNTALA